MYTDSCPGPTVTFPTALSHDSFTNREVQRIRFHSRNDPFQTLGLYSTSVNPSVLILTLETLGFKGTLRVQTSLFEEIMTREEGFVVGVLGGTGVGRTRGPGSTQSRVVSGTSSCSSATLPLRPDSMSGPVEQNRLRRPRTHPHTRLPRSGSTPLPSEPNRFEQRHLGIGPKP